MSTPRKGRCHRCGPAGYVCAIRLAQLGQSVTVVEKEFVGGTCLNVGCIPSKAMIAAGALLDKIKHADAMGISISGASLDIGKLVDWKAGIVAKLHRRRRRPAQEPRRDDGHGARHYSTRNTVSVKSSSGEQKLVADDIVIATGSIPIEIPGFAFDEDEVWSSTGGLAPKSIPQAIWS